MSGRWALAVGVVTIALATAQVARADDDIAKDGETSESESTPPTTTGPKGPPPPVVVISPPPPVPSPPPEPIEHPPPVAPLDNGGVEITLSGLSFAPSLARTRFSGAGTPIGSSRPAGFSHEGQELGLRTPRFYGGELRFAYLRRWFAVGVLGFYGGTNGIDATPTSRADAELVDAKSLVVYGGALDLMGRLPMGPVTIGLGAAVGIRGYRMALSGYAPGVCRRRGSGGWNTTYPCAETASTSAQPFVLPRLQVDVALDNKKRFFVGGYAGVDAVSDATLAFGIVIGFRAPHETLLP